MVILVIVKCCVNSVNQGFSVYRYYLPPFFRYQIIFWGGGVQNWEKVVI